MEVENIIAQHLNIDVSEVTDDKHLMEDLGADSLHTVELVIEFENHFDMTDIWLSAYIDLHLRFCIHSRGGTRF